jgi:hypothetical protein
MDGFRRFEWINYHVVEPAPGVFLLSNDGESVLEVGRSDTDVAAEIRKRCESGRGLDNRYSYFWLECCPDAATAYRRHCRLWHRHGSRGEHPQPPAGSGLVCSFPDCNPAGISKAPIKLDIKVNFGPPAAP